MIRFHKMHGLGNDFVVIDGRGSMAAHAAVVDQSLARALADRHRGVGCDQVIVLSDPPAGDEADVAMRIFNADGSEVAACGNATRCVPVLLGADVRIRTTAGLLDGRRADGGADVGMGRPRFGWDEVPIAEPLDTLALPLAWEELAAPVAVSMGNPHLVFFVDDVAAVPLDRLGPVIEHDPMFPERINVNIAQFVAPDHLVMRTWERGAGLTRACGTGACAVFAAARRTRRLKVASARIDPPGGQLRIAEDADGGIRMAGPAVHVFLGEIDAAVLA